MASEAEDRYYCMQDEVLEQQAAVFDLIRPARVSPDLKEAAFFKAVREEEARYWARARARARAREQWPQQT